MIKREGGARLPLSIMVTDVDLSMSDPYSLEIGGFHERHSMFGPERAPAGGERFLFEEDAAAVVYRWLRGATLVGLVTDFDTFTLGQMLRRHQYGTPWDYHLVDVRNMAIGWLRGKGVPWSEIPQKSDDLSLACNVAPPGEAARHTAMGDAEWVERWYDAIRGEE